MRIIDLGTPYAPFRAHALDAGADVISPVDCVVHPGTCVKINLGFGLDLPPNTAGYIEPRGSLGELGLIPISNPIDAGYRGPIHAVMWNISSKPIRICAKDRIAQLVIRPVIVEPIEMIKPQDAAASDRGTGNYGSSGRSAVWKN